MRFFPSVFNQEQYPLCTITWSKTCSLSSPSVSPPFALSKIWMCREARRDSYTQGWTAEERCCLIFGLHWNSYYLSLTAQRLKWNISFQINVGSSTFYFSKQITWHTGPPAIYEAHPWDTMCILLLSIIAQPQKDAGRILSRWSSAIMYLRHGFQQPPNAYD